MFSSVGFQNLLKKQKDFQMVLTPLSMMPRCQDDRLLFSRLVSQFRKQLIEYRLQRAYMTFITVNIHEGLPNIL